MISYLWQNDQHYGDWLSYASTSSAYMGAYTETDLIASAYFAYSSTLMSKIARILGRSEDARQYQELADKIKKAFFNEFVTPNGRLVSHTQTAYTLALAMDILPDSFRKKAAEYLNQNVKRFEHITTGFLGTPLISQTLTDYGYLDTALYAAQSQRISLLVISGYHGGNNNMGKVGWNKTGFYVSKPWYELP